MRIEARAKINWTLDITGRAENGYHLMDMLMQPVTLADTVTLLPADTLTLTTGGSPLLPADESHLALRAARALQKAAGCASGASIDVYKRIPVGAGMGGGSADAAAVLAGLNRLWGLGLSQEALEAVGLTLGADVPFCLRGGLARTTGIGEKMQDLGPGPVVPLCVIQPCAGLSTAEAFRVFHEHPKTNTPDTDAARDALLRGDLTALGRAGGNVMRVPSAALRPPIGEAVQALMDAGALYAEMTGSGSAVFGAFADKTAAERAAAALSARWERCRVCESCAEPLVFES